MTVNLETAPESVRLPVVSNVAPREVTMLMEYRVVFAQGLSIDPLVPPVVPDAGPMFAKQLEKVIELKLANGSTPELDEGASSIHSAEDRCASSSFASCCTISRSNCP